MARILLAGEQRGYPKLLKGTLEAAGFTVVPADLATLLQKPEVLRDAALILLETKAGDSANVLLCQRIRELADTPLVVFGGNLGERDVVPALEAGADDIMVMPMRPVEVTARLRAVLRRIEKRSARVMDGRLVSGDIEISLEEKRAYRRGEPLNLSPIELRLLTLLAQEAGRPLSHARIIAQVWGPEYTDCRHYLRLYIRYLREKIEDEPHAPRIILNEWGTGYRLEPQAVA